MEGYFVALFSILLGNCDKKGAFFITGPFGLKGHVILWRTPRRKPLLS
jgi:hypothetical protein